MWKKGTLTKYKEIFSSIFEADPDLPGANKKRVLPGITGTIATSFECL